MEHKLEDQEDTLHSQRSMVDQEQANRRIGTKTCHHNECQLVQYKQQWLRANISLAEKNSHEFHPLDVREEPEASSARLAKLKQFFKRSPLSCFHSNKEAAISNGYDRQDLASKCAGLSNVNVDSGYAWIILAVMFFINASTFGTARAYGLIFEKLVRQGEQTRSQAALPFTIMGAVENMAGPMTGYLLTRTGSWRLTVFIGSSLITLSHLLAALLDSLPGQIVSIGLMCGIGQSFVTISSFQINNSYFVRYRSRAFGLGLTGAAFGTLYISPLCQYVLNNYNHQLCYLMLGLILLPNVPLSLLLKPNKDSQQPIAVTDITSLPPPNNMTKEQIQTISGDLKASDNKLIGEKETSVWESIKVIIRNPFFHLIWTTQLLFCWFNFVFGMIIVDFGRDRELDSHQVAKLIPIWAFGQLVGRLLLGSLVDFRLVSYELFTVICFGSIGAITWTLNNVHGETQEQQDILISLLVFTLSMFISNLYILFNGLVVSYMDKSLTALSIGISSFTSSFFLLPRASTIGYYRDTIGNYDAMLSMFTYVALIAALVWLLVSFYKPKR